MPMVTTYLGFAIAYVSTMVVVTPNMFLKPTCVHSVFDYWWPIWLGFAFRLGVYEHNFGFT